MTRGERPLRSEENIQMSQLLVDEQKSASRPYDIPDGPTPRHVLLKRNYLRQVPTISIYRARAITKIARENPGLPRIELRAKAFRYCCETAPLVIQDNELIVGAPCGSPRAGAFSPDISWRWLRDELDTIAHRPRIPSLFPRKTRRSSEKKFSPTGKENPLTNTARPSTAKPECGLSPANPSSLTAPTTP